LKAALASGQTLQKKLAAEAVTALLNSASHFGYKYTTQQVIKLVRNAWSSSTNSAALLDDLKDANAGTCPLS
jgi:ABC-type hemin transport system ATPase subunit